MKKINHKSSKQINLLESQLKRALADYHNLERRYQKEKQKLSFYATESLLDKLLPILDDLQRAQRHIKDTGLSHILTQFKLTLTSEGLKEIESDNQKFNPETMDCVEVVKGKKDQVVKTRLKGYYYNDKVLRPAQVEVGGGKSNKPK